jgi:hypothetical protein
MVTVAGGVGMMISSGLQALSRRKHKGEMRRSSRKTLVPDLFMFAPLVFDI